MRRILIEQARRKATSKRGGRHGRADLSDAAATAAAAPDELLAVDEALEALAAEDPAAAELVKLRYYAGLSVEEAAAVNLSRSAAYDHWAFGRAWLADHLGGAPEAES